MQCAADIVDVEVRAVFARNQANPDVYIYISIKVTITQVAYDDSSCTWRLGLVSIVDDFVYIF